MMRRGFISSGLTSLVLFTLLAIVSFGYDTAHARKMVYDYLDEALLAPVAVRNSVTWSDPEVALTRAFSKVDERVIGKATSEVWSAFAVAQKTGETGILPDYFSGVALKRADLAAKQSHLAGTRMGYLNMTGTPEFYHLDGSVFQAQFQALAIRFAGDENGLELFRATKETLVTTFMNESSGWRVFAHERRTAEPVSVRQVRVEDIRLAGINYYPSKTPWRAFWREFDARIIADDFDRIAELGGNSVRVFLPSETFLSPSNERDLKNLDVLLNTAAARGLKVVPTLFDLKGGYALAGWSDDANYLRNVLPILADNDAVSFVDIKNEPDLDFKHHGKAQVEAWVRAMVVLCRDLAPDLALTVGWSDADHAVVAADALDLITYHEYRPLEGTSDRLADVRRIAGDKPVMITEIGETVWSALSAGPESQQKQADRLSARFELLEAADGIFVWTLHDFPNPDPKAVGSKPWVRKSQSEFGLFDDNGSPKPAAKAVTDGFSNFLKGKNND